MKREMELTQIQVYTVPHDHWMLFGSNLKVI